MNYLNYGVFLDHASAEQAQQAIRHELDEAAEVIEQSEQLYNKDVPLKGTLARSGLLFGAVAVAAAAMAAISLAIWAGIGTGRVLAPGGAVVLVAVVAMLFGGLAGAIAFSTSNRSRIRRLDRHIRLGRRLVLIQSEHDLSEFLLRRGAVEAGRVG